MQAEPVRSVQLGPVQVTLATGARGELLHLLTAPPEVRMRLKVVGALPATAGEMIMGGFRQTILVPVRGRSLTVLATELGEEEVCQALRMAAEALFALAAEGARLPEGSVTLSSLVQQADGRWIFDLVGSLLQEVGGEERAAAGPGVHLSALVQQLQSVSLAGRAPRLRRLALFLIDHPQPELAGILELLANAPGATRPVWPVIVGAGALGLVFAIAAAYFTGDFINQAFFRDLDERQYQQEMVPDDRSLLLEWPASDKSMLRGPVAVAPETPAPAQERAPEAVTPSDRRSLPAPTPAPAPAPVPTPAPTPPSSPAPAPEPARPLGAVDIVIRHSDGVAILHGWSGQPTTWIALDDLVGFLGAEQRILPSGRRQLSWQFGKVGIAHLIELEMTDANGIRYVPLTPGLQSAIRLHAAGWDAGSFYFDREQPG